MTSFRIRPRFKIHSRYSPEEVKARILSKVAEEACGCYAEISNEHIFLRIKQKDQHTWSPQLDISCEVVEDGIVLKGLYGPHPHVWTFFMLSYLAIGISALFIAMIGLVRWNLDMTAYVLWALPVLGLMALALYIASQLGQKLGAEQTFLLHHFLEDILDERVKVV